jgi:adenylate kinase family enzyme
VGKKNARERLVEHGYLPMEASAMIREASDRNQHIAAQVHRFKRTSPPWALLGDVLMNVIFDEIFHHMRTRPNLVFDSYPRTPGQFEHFMHEMRHRRYDVRFGFLHAPEDVCRERACVSRAHEGRPDDAPHIHQRRMEIWRGNYRNLRKRAREGTQPGSIFDVNTVHPPEVVGQRVVELAV